MKAVSQVFVTDAVRMGVVSAGKVNELLKNTGLYCSHELRDTFAPFKDTYNDHELDLIEKHIFNPESDPAIFQTHVNPLDPANPTFYSGYNLLEGWIFDDNSAIRNVSGKIKFPLGVIPDFSNQYLKSLGNGPVSRCANIYKAATDMAVWAASTDAALPPGTCCNAALLEPIANDDGTTTTTVQALGLVPGLLLAEHSICQNPAFCDPSGNTVGKCCGSCLPYFLNLQAKAAGASAQATGAPKDMNSDPSEVMSEKVQAQFWEDGLAECITEGTVTEDTKQCTASQATYSQRLKDELPRMFSCDPTGSMQVNADIATI
jgi:hypothetical protein